jgi:hypothetical protein
MRRSFIAAALVAAGASGARADGIDGLDQTDTFDEVGTLIERLELTSLPLRDPTIAGVVAAAPGDRVRIDAHDVTGVRSGGLGTAILAEFVEKVATATGNAGVESESSTGSESRISIRGGASSTHADLFGTYALHASTVGGDARGAIVKNHLWYFAGVAAQTASDDASSWRSYQAVAKLTLRDGDHAGELEAIAIPSELDGKRTLAADVGGHYVLDIGRYTFGAMMGWHHGSDRIGLAPELDNRFEEAVGGQHASRHHLTYMQLELAGEDVGDGDLGVIRTGGYVGDRWVLCECVAIRAGVRVEHQALRGPHELSLTGVAPEINIDLDPGGHGESHVFAGWRRAITDILLDPALTHDAVSAPYQDQVVAGVEHRVGEGTSAIAYVQHDRVDATVIAVQRHLRSGLWARLAYRFSGASDLRVDAFYQHDFAASSAFTAGLRYRAFTGTCGAGAQNLDLHLAVRQARRWGQVELFGDLFGALDPPPPPQCDPDLAEIDPRLLQVDPRMPRQPARFAQVGARIAF